MPQPKQKAHPDDATDVATWKRRSKRQTAQIQKLYDRTDALERENDQLRRALGAISDIARRYRGEDPYAESAANSSTVNFRGFPLKLLTGGVR